jgi:hypothetical protein
MAGVFHRRQLQVVVQWRIVSSDGILTDTHRRCGLALLLFVRQLCLYSLLRRGGSSSLHLLPTTIWHSLSPCRHRPPSTNPDGPLSTTHPEGHTVRKSAAPETWHARSCLRNEQPASQNACCRVKCPCSPKFPRMRIESFPALGLPAPPHLVRLTLTPAPHQRHE